MVYKLVLIKNTLQSKVLIKLLQNNNQLVFPPLRNLQDCALESLLNFPSPGKDKMNLIEQDMSSVKS